MPKRNVRKIAVRREESLNGHRCQSFQREEEGRKILDGMGGPLPSWRRAGLKTSKSPGPGRGVVKIKLRPYQTFLLSRGGNQIGSSKWGGRSVWVKGENRGQGVLALTESKAGRLTKWEKGRTAKPSSAKRDKAQGTQRVKKKVLTGGKQEAWADKATKHLSNNRAGESSQRAKKNITKGGV